MRTGSVSNLLTRSVARGESQRWELVQEVDLGAFVYAFAPHPGGGLVLVTNADVMLYRDSQIRSIRTVDYRAMYPNSVVVSSSGTILVGMSHVVAKLTPLVDGYSEKWLVPPHCRYSIPRRDPNRPCKSSRRPK